MYVHIHVPNIYPVHKTAHKDNPASLGGRAIDPLARPASQRRIEEGTGGTGGPGAPLCGFKYEVGMGCFLGDGVVLSFCLLLPVLLTS